MSSTGWQPMTVTSTVKEQLEYIKGNLSFSDLIQQLIDSSPLSQQLPKSQSQQQEATTHDSQP